MNANQMINMIVRMVFRKFLNRGINAGIDHVSRRGKAGDELTPEERRRARQGRKQGQRARKLMRATRRMGRF